MFCVCVSFYFSLFLFISLYLFVFMNKCIYMIFFNVFFLFLDQPNHVETNLLQPAPPISLADIR